MAIVCYVRFCFCSNFCSLHTGAGLIVQSFMIIVVGNEDAKDKDWRRLGYMLKRTAENHGWFSPEIDDLFQNIQNGTLKG